MPIYLLGVHIAKNRNYIITRASCRPSRKGKYCMEKRGVAVPELSTVQKKPEYHADFVIWGLEPYAFTKVQRKHD